MNDHRPTLISLDDSPAPHTEALGWQWAFGCFETFIWRDGGTIGLDRHLVRFRKGIDHLHLRPPFPLEDLPNRIAGSLHPHRESILRVRLEAVLDDPGLMAGSPPPHPMRLGMRVKEMTASESRRPFNVRLLPPGSAEALPPLSGYKPLNYVDRLRFRNEIQQAGFSEGILCTKDLRIVSGLFSNLVIRNANGMWMTPGLDSGCLPGVTRALLLEMGGGVEVCEEDLHLHDLHEAKAAVLVNSGWGVQPVVGVALEGESIRELDVEPSRELAAWFAETRR